MRVNSTETIKHNHDVCLQNVEFTLGDESEMNRKREMSYAELTQQLDRLLQEKADNQRIFDWVEVCIALLIFIYSFTAQMSQSCA